MIYDNSKCTSIRVKKGDDFFLRSLHLGESLRFIYNESGVYFEQYSIEDANELIHKGADFVDFPDAINLTLNMFKDYRVEDNNGKLDIYLVKEGTETRVYPIKASIDEYTI